MKLFLKKLKEKKGFTLIELVIVIAVLGILMAMAVPSYQGFIERARVSNDKAFSTIIEKSISFLMADQILRDGDEITIVNVAAPASAAAGTSPTIKVSVKSGATTVEATTIVENTDNAPTAILKMLADSSTKKNYWQSTQFSKGCTYTIAAGVITAAPIS